jgi:hypothetical protein
MICPTIQPNNTNIGNVCDYRNLLEHNR